MSENDEARALVDFSGQGRTGEIRESDVRPIDWRRVRRRLRAWTWVLLVAVCFLLGYVVGRR